MNIAILKHGYHPDLTGIEQPRFELDHNGNPREFELDEAKRIIEQWENEPYVLSHGESGRPTYLIVESIDGNNIYSGRNGDMSTYDWPDDMNCNACGECTACMQLMIDQDRDYLIRHAVYKS